MMHVFSDLEGIRIAIEMEKRGESFYRRAARVSHDNTVVELLLRLADDERGHIHEFERIYERESTNLSDTAYSDETNSFLSAIAADVVFPNGLMALRETGFENISAVLLNAIASEKDSIMFYSELKDLTSDAHSRSVFMELASQERGHLLRLQRQLAQVTQ